MSFNISISKIDSRFYSLKNSNINTLRPLPSYENNSKPVIFGANKLSNYMLEAFRANAINFNGGKSGMGGAMITVDPSTGFDARDIGDLLCIVGTDEGKRLLKKVVDKLKPLGDFTGQGKYAIRSITAIMLKPELEVVFDQVYDKFVSDNKSKDHYINRNMAELLESFKPDNKNHQKLLQAIMQVPKVNSINAISDIIKTTDDRNIELTSMLIHNYGKNEIFNGAEVLMLVRELERSPEKMNLLKKLLTSFRKEGRTVSDTLALIENYDIKNTAHPEMLDFLLSIKDEKDFWGLFLGQLLEKTTPENKDQIKEIINNTPGNGMDAATIVIQQVNAL
ncbi:MAG: hypothetical protein AB1782_01625 [Cyanobacteriota bacterium]